MKQGVLCVLVMCVGASVAFGQLPTGTILGIVKDSSGAVIPGANVTAVQTETNQSRSVATGEDGAYRFDALAIGTYQITVQAGGFQTVVQNGLTLTVAQEAVSNFSLQVGAVSQTVSVSAEAVSLIDTTTSSLGSLVNDQSISDLPLNGRNYNDLTLLQGGVTMTTNSNSASLGWSGTQFSSNGAPVRSNNYMLDGGILNNALSTNGASVTGTTLGVDGIQEYRIITNNFNAEYGLTMGSQMLIVSKSGTNEFHGDAFDFLRNSVFDARNYFDLPPAKIGHRLPEFRRNQFGGAVGGPIKQDETFFFGVFEGLRASLGTTNTATTLFGGNGTTTTGCQPGPSTAANYNNIWNGVGIIPANAFASSDCPQLGGSASSVTTIAPQMIPIVQLYPSPNLPSNQFGFVYQQVTSENYGQIRIDQTLSSADNLLGRYTVDQANSSSPGSFNQTYTHLQSRNQFLTVAENHIFSPSLLNSARFSFSRTPLQIASPLLDPLLGTPPYEETAGLPMGLLQPGGLSALGPNSLAPRTYKQNIFTGSDDLNYTKDKHSFKFGVIFNHYQNYWQVHGYDRTVIHFANVAQFFNAQMSSIAEVEPGANVNKYYRWDTMGFYGQDAWRVTPKLTLNFGLRYEPTTTYSEVHGRQTALIHPATDTTFSLAPAFKNPSLKNWGPRVGFAWDVFGNGRAAVRGGFSELYDLSTFGSSLAIDAGYDPPYAVAYTATSGTLTIPFTPPAAGTFPESAEGPTYNMRQPHLLAYNMAVEEQLPGSMALTLAYAGSRGIDLMQLNDGNPELPTGYPTVGTSGGVTGTICAAGTTPNTNFANQFDGSAATSCYLTTSPRVNPVFGSFAYNFASGDSFYNALEINVNKRLTRGLQVQGAYTWSHLIDDSQGESGGDATTAFREPLHNSSRRANGDFDLRNVFHLSAIYHLPDFTASKSFVGEVSNGWGMSGILALESGYPFTTYISSFRTQDNTISIFGTLPDIPDIVPGRDNNNMTHGVSVGCGTGASRSNGGSMIPAGTPLRTPSLWFDPCAFSNEAAGFVGTELRNFLRGPGLDTTNFSIFKDTPVSKLGEKGSMEFRAEFFNVFNHPNFNLPGSLISGGTCGANVLTGCSFVAGTPNAQNPLSTAGLITSTVTTSRQIQFGLKLIF